MDYKVIVSDLSLKNNQYTFFLRAGLKFMISSIDISNTLLISLEEFDERLTKCLKENAIKHVFSEDTPERPSHCISFKKLESVEFYQKAFEEEFKNELILLKLS